jgi:ATP-dependent DNA helicase RecG
MPIKIRALLFTWQVSNPLLPIETWGRGIDKIINGFAKANLPEPEFKEIAGGVEVSLFKNLNVVEKRLLKIINLIKENKQISASEIAFQLNITERTIQRDINKLKKKNKIKRIGPAKGGYWEVIDEFV